MFPVRVKLNKVFNFLEIIKIRGVTEIRKIPNFPGPPKVCSFHQNWECLFSEIPGSCEQHNG